MSDFCRYMKRDNINIQGMGAINMDTADDESVSFINEVLRECDGGHKSSRCQMRRIDELVVVATTTNCVRV